MKRKFKLAIATCVLPLSCFHSYHCLSAKKINAPPFLLAENFNHTTALSQYMVSEKLDGVRAYWNGKKLITRSGRTINSPHWFTQNFPNEPLDGELWISRNQFEKISGITRKKEPDNSEWKLIQYMVFDLPQNLSTFNLRFTKLTQLVNDSKNQHLKLIPQFEVQSTAELNNQLNKVIAKKGEGLMLHKKNSLYQAKRTNDLQKLKKHDDDEAVVIAHVSGKGQYDGLLGSIVVMNKDGVKFKIGSGFNLKEREFPPAVGSTITYRFRGKTKNNIPRFATFLRVRNED